MFCLEFHYSFDDYVCVMVFIYIILLDSVTPFKLEKQHIIKAIAFKAVQITTSSRLQKSCTACSNRRTHK